MSASLEKGIRVLKEVIDAPIASYFNSCVHCGLCAEACLFYTETGDPKYTPIHKLEPLRRIYEQGEYIADQVPASGLAPAAGTMARYRLMEWLNFISTELHKSFTPLFTPGMPDEAKAIYRERLLGRFKYLDQQLEGKSYLMGDGFTVADAYLFTVSSWCKHVGVDISGLPTLGAYIGRVAARPAVQAALRAEGLIQ